MRHKISVLVENRFGELSRIVGLFSARGLNIESLSVADATDANVSCLTMVSEGDSESMEKITRLLNRQVRVLRAVDMTGIRHVEREMVLLNIEARTAASRNEILTLVHLFGGKVVEALAEAITIEYTGERRAVNELIGLLKPIGIVEMSRTGTVAIPSGNVAPDEPADIDSHSAALETISEGGV